MVIMRHQPTPPGATLTHGVLVLAECMCRQTWAHMGKQHTERVIQGVGDNARHCEHAEAVMGDGGDDDAEGAGKEGEG